MPGSKERVRKALAHETPDRTPLFEIFQPFHPIHWPIVGRTIATDAERYWDALAEGVSRAEVIEAQADAGFLVARYFEVDMVRLNAAAPRTLPRPVKTGPGAWTLNGVPYAVNARTHMVDLARPGEGDAYSRRESEKQLRVRIEAWDGTVPDHDSGPDPVFLKVRERAEAEGLDWVFMAEIGAGTGAAFYPPFMLMWMLDEHEWYGRWLEMVSSSAFRKTRRLIEHGHEVIAMGGDVSSDKGPFISPALYREWILPVIRRHVAVIHEHGASAVYTSDGNHWAIKEEFFFLSGIDGYKEVDRAAGMTWERLIEEHVADRVCVIGNLDARHTLCHGTPEEVRTETVECLRFGGQRPGGHILHASHSVHEDVRPENYIAAVEAYRSFFGLPPLPR